MQQYLPFTVLKQRYRKYTTMAFVDVATVLTVYGIETVKAEIFTSTFVIVATVLTVYGIETYNKPHRKIFVVQRCNSTYRLRY